MRLPLCLLLLSASPVLLSPACRKAPVEAAYDDLVWKNDLFWLDGKPFTGIARAAHGDGKPKSEYPFREGRLHGVVREWWDNGVQSTETHFEHGKRHGGNKYWDREGKLTKEQVYEHDRSVSVRHY